MLEHEQKNIAATKTMCSQKCDNLTKSRHDFDEVENLRMPAVMMILMMTVGVGYLLIVLLLT